MHYSLLFTEFTFPIKIDKSWVYSSMHQMNHGNLIQFHLVKLPRTINRKISRKRNSEQSEKSAKYKFTVDQLKSLQSNKINARKIAAQTEIWQIFWAIQTEVAVFIQFKCRVHMHKNSKKYCNSDENNDISFILLQIPSHIYQWISWIHLFYHYHYSESIENNSRFINYFGAISKYYNIYSLLNICYGYCIVYCRLKISYVKWWYAFGHFLFSLPA